MSTTVRETEKFERRWFRFSLRTLFAAVTVFALLFGWIGWNVWQVRSETSFISDSSSMEKLYLG